MGDISTAITQGKGILFPGRYDFSFAKGFIFYQ